MAWPTVALAATELPRETQLMEVLVLRDRRWWIGAYHNEDVKQA